MDPAQRTRWIQLGILGVILLAVVKFVLIPSLATPVVAPAPAPVPAPARPGGRPAAATPGAGPIEVRLDALGRAAATPESGGPQRNPFRMGAATPAPSAAGGPGGGAGVSPRPVTPVVPQPALPPVPTLPPIPYRFIGVLAGAPGRGRIAVLTDGKTVVHGQVNTEIEGRFRIVQIGEESLQIEYIDGRGRQTLRLLGQ